MNFTFHSILAKSLCQHSLQPLCHPCFLSPLQWRLRKNNRKHLKFEIHDCDDAGFIQMQNLMNHVLSELEHQLIATTVLTRATVEC